MEVKRASLSDTELVARLFRVLGERTRLRILDLLLEEGELHQAEIVRRLHASQARVSEHLGCLVWCGFVEARTQGRRTFYGVADTRVIEVLDWARHFLHGNDAQVASCRRVAEGGDS